jgi:hypothetical protein
MRQDDEGRVCVCHIIMVIVYTYEDTIRVYCPADLGMQESSLTCDRQDTPQWKWTQ